VRVCGNRTDQREPISTVLNAPRRHYADAPDPSAMGGQNIDIMAMYYA
jgi:hypothetical protein